MVGNDRKWQDIASFGKKCPALMADIGDPNFLHNSIQNVLKYTGRIYSTKSLQIRGVFAVQVHVRRVRGASNQKHSQCHVNREIHSNPALEQHAEIPRTGNFLNVIELI